MDPDTAFALALTLTLGVPVLVILAAVAAFVIGVIAGTADLIASSARRRDRVPSSALVHG